MKIFYSELTANPSYYSFGYSIYGEFEDIDTLDDVYEKGFLPCAVAKKQSPKLMYVARGVRVKAKEYVQKHFHTRVIKKVAQTFPSGVTSTVYAKDAYNDIPKVIDFFSTYFAFRFGKEAMPRDRIESIVRSPFLTHIVAYHSDEIFIGYSLEVHGESFVHVWHQAYAKKYARTHVGIYMYMELIERAKNALKQYVYFGVTYGTWMNYKTNFQPLSFWDGTQWVDDKKSEKLKSLFRCDPTRLLAFVDEWRKEKDPYYKAPYPFQSMLEELRYCVIFTTLHPRIFGVYLCLLGLLCALVYIKFFL
jgi:hypothetical protein